MKITENQDGEDDEEAAAYDSPEQTLGSDSNFSDLDRNRLVQSENLLGFFLRDPVVDVAVNVGST